jgi:cell division protein FtsI/penicillin-binding protein 2
MTFGQGLDATMIQVSAGFCSIINGGTFYKPSVIAGEIIDGQYQPVKTFTPVRQGVVKASTSKEIRDMTIAARTFSFPGQDKAGYAIGGKTGTSQVIKNGQYADDETVATYLGFGGGTDGPDYVIMVSVSGEHKLFGGAAHAMPIFTEVSNWMLDYLKIQPKG